MRPVDAEIQRLTDELSRGLSRYRKAKAAFVRTTARMADVTMPQPLQAQNAFDRKNAIADCDWYQRDVQTVAAALSALCLSQMGEPK